MEAGPPYRLNPGTNHAPPYCPLALKRMNPSLSDLFIISLKDTSLLMVIDARELVREGQGEPLYG